MKRRKFIQKTALSAAGISVLAGAGSSVFAAGANDYKYGIILSSLKNQVQEKPDETFRKLSEAGYTYIESIGRYGIPAEHTMKYVRKYNLTPITTGDGMAQLLNNTDHYLEIAEKYDLPYIVCYYPWLDSAENLTREKCLEAADNLNKMAKISNDAGRKFAWHNHHKEFVKLDDGTVVFDLLMDKTNRDVNLELDNYWVKYAGYSTLQVMDKYADRITLLHLKDMRPGAEKQNTAPGKGIIAFETLLDKVPETKTEYLVVEFAGDDLGVKDAVESIDYLKKL